MTKLRRSSILLAVVAVGALAGCGSQTGMAVVDGRTYALSVVRGIEVAEVDLTPYGRVEETNDRPRLLDDQAYSLTGVDPMTFLLVRAQPGIVDDLGPWGSWVGLMGDGEDLDLCPYFERFAPTWCE